MKELLDPKFFIETFFWIIDKNRQRVPFLFNGPQQKYFQNRTHHDLILKARKEGFSSLIEALWTHACLVMDNTRAVVISHERDSTMRHFERVRGYLNNLGDKRYKVEVDLDEESQKQIKFPHTNSSFWIGTAGARAFGRGDDITHLHLSEVAHYPNQDVLTSALEACVPNAYRVMETTAKGVGEAFHRLWKESEDPDSGSPWKGHFFAWHEDPTNVKELPRNNKFAPTLKEKQIQNRFALSTPQIYWYHEKRAELPDKSLMPQEYPSDAREAFLMSGRPAFNLEKLNVKLGLIKPPLYRGDVSDDGAELRFNHEEEGRLKVWEMPRHGKMYLISADVGEGVPGGDYSVMQIFDRASWVQVATWRGRIDPGDFGRHLCTLGYFYNNAALLPELNNHGWATVEAIKRAGYRHLVNSTEIWGEKETPKDGFPTNQKTRAQVITAIRNSIDDDTGFINDKTTIEEMMVFVQNEDTGKFEAQEGYHDDCVMSYGIGIYALKFLTVDETYASRSRMDEDRPLKVQSIVRRKTELSLEERRMRRRAA